MFSAPKLRKPLCCATSWCLQITHFVLLLLVRIVKILLFFDYYFYPGYERNQGLGITVSHISVKDICIFPVRCLIKDWMLLNCSWCNDDYLNLCAYRTWLTLSSSHFLFKAGFLLTHLEFFLTYSRIPESTTQYPHCVGWADQTFLIIFFCYFIGIFSCKSEVLIHMR